MDSLETKRDRTDNSNKENAWTIIESYFGNNRRSVNVLNEEETQLEGATNEPVYYTPEMQKYSNYMDREAKHNNY